MSRGRTAAVVALLAVASGACGCAAVQDTSARDRREACGVAFPYDVRARVGITEERLSRFGPPRTPIGQAVSRQIEARTPALAACAPRSRGLFATFLVDGTGRIAEPVAAALPPDEKVEACAAREIAGWELPDAVGSGGLFFASIRLGPGSAGSASAPRPGWRPAQPTEQCAFVAPRPTFLHEGALGSVDVALHATINFDGSVTDLHADRPLPEELFEELDRAVRACRFEPAWDEAGRPRNSWRTLALRIRPP